MERYMLHLKNNSDYNRKMANTILLQSRDLAYGMNLILRDCRISKKYIELDTSVPQVFLDDLVKKLQDDDQVAFTYDDNPNGSMGDIAGIFNENRNVLGMMPHPERAAESILGSSDGLAIFESMIENM